MEINLRIILLNPPAGVLYGLQKGSGNNYETIQKQEGKGMDLAFTCEARVEIPKSKKEAPNFLGPFIQGPKVGRFIYIDIGTYAGEHGSVWGRRLKIPLTGIGWEDLEKAQKNPNLIFCTQVPGTGKDGGPNCATVKPFEGWKLIIG
ncbi:MAG: hypothetical protein C5B52_02710 [Bacteroidetes bacterium]|nr:MAG: hypothetical protein C5B52_02710 [Bacteroidota bacterium]